MTIQILMRFSRDRISKCNLNKNKTVPESKIVKKYDGKKIEKII